MPQLCGCHPSSHGPGLKDCLPLPNDISSRFNKVSTLFPPQGEALDILRLNPKSNIIACTKTGTGKSMIPLLAIHLRLQSGDKPKAIFLEPLRQLCEEKTTEITALFPELNVTMITGEVEVDRPDILKNSDIIIATYELFDSLTRKPGKYNLSSFDLLVADEIHEIGDAGRGAAIDASITRFLIKKSGIQVILLSATFKNSDKLQSWIEKVTAFKTPIICSDFSPIKVHEYDIIPYKQSNRALTIVTKVNEILHGGKKGGILVLILSKTEQAKIVARINASNGQEIAKIHNADMNREDKLSTVEDFNNSKFRVLVSTPTLLSGVNISCESLVLDVSYYEPQNGSTVVLPAHKIRQAAGRVGRLPFYNEGFVHYVCNERVKSVARAHLTQELAVQSGLSIYTEEAINSEVAILRNTTRDELEFIFSMTFSHEIKQSPYVDLTFLTEYNFIKVDDEQVITPTTKGTLSSIYHLRPTFVQETLNALNAYPHDYKNTEHIIHFFSVIYRNVFNESIEKEIALRLSFSDMIVNSGNGVYSIRWSEDYNPAWLRSYSENLSRLQKLIEAVSPKDKHFLSRVCKILSKGIIPPMMLPLIDALEQNGVESVGRKRLLALWLNGVRPYAMIPQTFDIPIQINTDNLHQVNRSNFITTLNDKKTISSLLPSTITEKLISHGFLTPTQ